VAVAGENAEAPWFDMENCTFCKHMGANPEMMKAISWEQHAISDGIVCVTTVPDKFLPDYRKAHAAMVAAGEQMEQGGAMPMMCGSCMALGSCFMKGPKQEYVETKHGDVWIMTSDAAELAAELQAWAKRNQEELAKMKASDG
jgi:hypothetical protein